MLTNITHSNHYHLIPMQDVDSDTESTSQATDERVSRIGMQCLGMFAVIGAGVFAGGVALIYHDKEDIRVLGIPMMFLGFSIFFAAIGQLCHLEKQREEEEESV